MPPQDLAAEQCVLGSMLLSKDAIADVIEEIRGTDFYRPAHETVYEAVLDLYGRGEPADAVTVAAELQRKGDLGRIGGAPYLHTLIASVPSAANAGYYAAIVREKAILRRLVEAGTKITQIGYSGDGDIDDVVDRAQAEIYGVTEKRSSEDYAVLGEIMESALDEIEAIGSRGGQMVGVPTGFTDLDALTNGLHPGQLIVVAARPGVGKSALALDFARAASVKHGLASVIFSLEMSRTEITMRLLSAEARVPLHHMRQGSMSDDDWARLARRMGEVSSAPLYIDDSPNMTLMEIRAKCRRLRQRNDLRLVVLDYLQLMTSGKRVESRQVEVAEFSRNLKLLAKELGVPVVALSQLNRGPEQRTDKRPMLSDLRESGCLTADTRLMRADTGHEVSLGELLASDARDVPVWSLDDRLKLVPRTMTHVFPSGVKEVFRLRLASGREITATANHPFLTYDGWKPLGQLATGTRLAVARHVPPPLEIKPWNDDEVVMLAHLLGDGSFVRHQPIRYASIDEADLRAVTDAAPHEKFVPSGVFSLPKKQVGLFLRHLWATDGCVHRDVREQVRIYYASTSRRLADDVARLLLRFNILTRIETVHKTGYRDSFHVHVVSAENQVRFIEDVGVHGVRGVLAAEILAELRGITANPNVDTVPRDVWDRVREVLEETKLSHRQFAAATGTQFSGSTLWKRAPSRTRLAKVAAVLDCAELDVLATNDVFWDSVVSVESLGEQEVYDATVLGTHNFLAEGIPVHNSIEQDADMVILLHREDAYERESTRPGEADFIVAKHRNGPTANITVAFQGHYSRFVDMAQG
ncbi:replicative DNA helicase [Actinopolymorpha pittospori]|nr:replicative DNA helicase [Actinopolymorpha pittospori]